MRIVGHPQPHFRVFHLLVVVLEGHISILLAVEERGERVFFEIDVIDAVGPLVVARHDNLALQFSSELGLSRESGLITTFRFDLLHTAHDSTSEFLQ